VSKPSQDEAIFFLTPTPIQHQKCNSYSAPEALLTGATFDAEALERPEPHQTSPKKRCLVFLFLLWSIVFSTKTTDADLKNASIEALIAK